MINHARGVLIVLCGLLVIESVDGAYMLRQWNPSILTSKYILYPDQKRIVILQGDTQTFKFEAYDTATGEPAEIDEIYSNSMGQIHFEVAGDPYQGRTFGASDLKSIHLPHAGSKPVRIRISGDLGENGMTTFTNIGSIGAQGDILGDISTTGTIDYLTTSLNGRLLADVHIGDTILGYISLLSPQAHTGNIYVHLGCSHNVFVSGTYAGNLTFNYGFSGKVQISDDLTGSIVVNQGMSGHIKILDQLDGQIRLNGSLLDGTETDDIWVVGGMGASSAITVDYDGWDAADSWASGAQVRVGASTYTGNTPAVRVYEITQCKGDVNNDGAVDFDDIDPLVAAIDGAAGFEAAYPGLGGSRVFHADMNCDGNVDFDDIDPFVARIGQCCYEGCGDCPGLMLVIGPPTAAELAAAMLERVAPERLPLLTAAAQYISQTHPESSRRVYWQIVADTLAG